MASGMQNTCGRAIAGGSVPNLYNSERYRLRCRVTHRKGDGIFVGAALILLGLLYLWKPTVCRRGIWLTTSIAVRTLSETNYIRYMRGLGIVLIVAGLTLVVIALT